MVNFDDIRQELLFFYTIFIWIMGFIAGVATGLSRDNKKTRKRNVTYTDKDNKK